MTDAVRRYSDSSSAELQYLFAFRVYALSMVFTVISLIQWLIILNFGSQLDLYDSIISLSTFSIALIIVTLYIVLDCLGAILPVYFQWALALILVECFTLAVGTAVNKCTNSMFCVSFLASLAAYAISSLIGMQILHMHSVVFVLLFFVWCILCFLALMTTILIAIFYSVTISLYIFAGIAYITVILMLIYDSMIFNTFLIGVPRIKKCIRPALNLYAEHTFLFFLTLIVWLQSLGDL